ncbi:hypothetical protein [Streptomyces sp. CoH17]|uniref:hypothetical protein n=1 Tax=Streptomyces sp. CoH17 TaxID=2992806 RepID=UPI00226FE8BB|nr:hypothetical protein [Streptomyces sp. CoH17]
MDTETQATLAAALAAGYALGRTKKGRVAIGVASVLAGQGLLSPKELINRALRKAFGSPQATQLLDQVRGELKDSARSALSATADRRLGALADSLQQRTDSLVGRRGDEDEGPSEEAEPDDEERQEEGTGGGEGDDPQVPPRRTRAKKSPAKGSASRTAPAKKAPAGRKSAASKPAEKKLASGKASNRGGRRR